MILVTGATGTIGSETVHSLKAKGIPFKVGARSPEKLKAPGVDAVEFDWAKPATYEASLRGVTRVFLLTPVVQEQVAYGKALVEAAKKAGVKHVVRLSVIGADAEPGIALGRMHRDVEKAIETSGLAWTFLRPTFFMQNFVNYYGVKPKEDSTIYLPHGNGKASWVDARDVGECAAVTLSSDQHAGKAYDLTGPEALSDAECVSILGQALGHKYAYVDVPEAAARKAMADTNVPGWLVDGFMELHAIVRNGWSESIAPGVKQILGREPRTFKAWAAEFSASNKN